eukprot:scaffold83677_cov59-Phaeocystis_antarctica.AAC.2
MAVRPEARLSLGLTRQQARRAASPQRATRVVTRVDSRGDGDRLRRTPPARLRERRAATATTTSTAAAAAAATAAAAAAGLLCAQHTLQRIGLGLGCVGLGLGIGLGLGLTCSVLAKRSSSSVGSSEVCAGARLLPAAVLPAPVLPAPVLPAPVLPAPAAARGPPASPPTALSAAPPAAPPWSAVPPSCCLRSCEGESEGEGRGRGQGQGQSKRQGEGQGEGQGLGQGQGQARADGLRGALGEQRDLAEREGAARRVAARREQHAACRCARRVWGSSPVWHTCGLERHARARLAEDDLGELLRGGGALGVHVQLLAHGSDARLDAAPVEGATVEPLLRVVARHIGGGVLAKGDLVAQQPAHHRATVHAHELPIVLEQGVRAGAALHARRRHEQTQARAGKVWGENAPRDRLSRPNVSFGEWCRAHGGDRCAHVLARASSIAWMSTRCSSIASLVSTSSIASSIATSIE